MTGITAALYQFGEQNTGVDRSQTQAAATAANKIRIAAIIPCYNTQKHITDVVKRTQRYVDQVIVVDDGSADRTAQTAREAGARVYQHPVNRGKGAAMKTAAGHADADILVFLDGDGQHNPEDIPHMLLPIARGEADFVIGSRYLKESRLTANPLVRRLANATASMVISLIISIVQPAAAFLCGWRNRGIPDRRPFNPGTANNPSKPRHPRVLNGGFKWISDCTSGFTATRKQCWDSLDLIADRYQIETEVIFEQAKHGNIIAEMPISCVWGESASKLLIIGDGLKTLKLLLYKLAHYSRGKKQGSEKPAGRAPGSGRQPE